jgi:hypothetical protein
VSAPGRDQRTGDPREDARYAQLLADLQRLLRIPFLRGTLVEVQLQVGANEVAHGLDRVPVGWFPARVTGAAFSAFEREASRRFLSLDSATACRVWLWVW